jgi:hypothetical protein
MAVQIRDAAGTPRPTPFFRVRDASGALRLIDEGWARDDGNVPRLFLPGLTGAMEPPSYSRSVGIWNFPVTIGTDPIIFNVQNGLPPITYAWLYVSGAAQIQIVPPTANTAMVHFEAYFPEDASHTAVIKCTATDAAGRVVEGTISVTLTTVDLD